MDESCVDGDYIAHICESKYEDNFELSRTCNTADRRYTCGGCSKKLQTICLLHEHLLQEFLLGSYMYDHVTKTAYPKQALATAGTQTEVQDLVMLENYSNSLLSDPGIDKDNIIENPHNTLQVGENGQISQKRKRKYPKRKDVHNLDKVLEKRTKSSKKKVSKEIETLKEKPGKEKIESRFSEELVPLSHDTTSKVKTDEFNLKEETLNVYDESTDDNLDLDMVEEEMKKITEVLDDNQYVRKTINRSKKKNNDRRKGKKNNKVKNRKKEVLEEKEMKNKYADLENIFSNTEVTSDESDVESCTASDVTEKGMSGLSNVEKENFNCKHCDNTFSSEKRLNAHLQSTHRCIYPYSCKQCNRKPFQNKEEYLEHKKLHPKQIYNCDLCGKELRSREGLRLHELIHSGEKPFSCDKCDYRGRTSTQLRQHMYNHTDTKTEQCEHCGKAFFTKGKLKEHLRYCRKEFNHHCPHCQKGFPTASGLRKHVLMHTGERAFICDVCGFATFRITLLNSHMRTHTGEKPHKCKECGAQLATRGTLLLHLRTHTHEKPFVCTYCSKAFTSKWNLQTHLRQHTGETPYKCDICGQGFKQNVLRKTHMRGHLESTSTEPAVRAHIDSTPEIHITTQLGTDSSEKAINSHMDPSETVEPASIPENRLEPTKSHIDNFIYERSMSGDLLHQALQSENLHPLDLKLHFSSTEDLKNSYNTSVINSHQLQSNTFEMINYQDIKHV